MKPKYLPDAYVPCEGPEGTMNHSHQVRAGKRGSGITQKCSGGSRLHARTDGGRGGQRAGLLNSHAWG